MFAKFWFKQWNDHENMLFCFREYSFKTLAIKTKKNLLREKTLAKSSHGTSSGNDGLVRLTIISLTNRVVKI